MNIGYGAYDGFSSVKGFAGQGVQIPPQQSGEWNDSQCGPTGASCREKVTKENLTELLDHAGSARDCAQKCAAGSGCSTCAVKSHLKAIVTKGANLRQRLQAQNPQASLFFETAVFDPYDGIVSWVGTPENGWQDKAYMDAKWESIWNSMDGGCSEYCGHRVYAPFKPGDGTIIGNLLKARDQIYFLDNLTPAQNARRVGYIQGLINNLKPRLQAKLNEIGGEYSASGAFVGTDLGPLQGEIADIQRKIREAWITEESRQQLQDEVLDLLKISQKATVKASKEGKTTAKVATQVNDTLQTLVDQGAEAASLAKCLASKEHIYKLGCFYTPNRILYGIIGTVILLAILGWIAMPYITLLS